MLYQIYPDRNDAIREIEKMRMELLLLSTYPDEESDSIASPPPRMVDAALSYEEALDLADEEKLQTASTKELHHILSTLQKWVRAAKSLG